MSQEYDNYIRQHKVNVVRGFNWLRTNLPQIFPAACDYANQIAEHDQSKYNQNEYDAYDAYFYGEKTDAVEKAFNHAWLTHIHLNPHHWQYWVLINDDPGEGQIALEMPHNYIIEMICDWWAFSWQKGDLSEIFSWYDEHSEYIILAPETRKTVEDILWELRGRLGFNVLAHHGVKGQKWGVRNGPPYPLDKSPKGDTIVRDAIDSGEVSTTINPNKQRRHTASDHDPGRSYLDGDIEYAQALVDRLGGTGIPVRDTKGNWTKRERVTDSENIGTHVNPDNGTETKTNKAIIVYSKTGAHVYPAKRKEDEK